MTKRQRSATQLPATISVERAGFLKLYNAAGRALAQVHRVDEVKAIRDKMVAMQTYAKQAKDTTLITQATEIRMRSERRAGELLVAMAKKGERAVRKNMKSQPATSKLSDFGINRTQSSRWQALAALDPDRFEAKVEDASKRAYDGIARRFVKEFEIERAQRRHGKIIEHGCTVDDLTALAESGKRFPVILCDPPWPYGTWGHAGTIHSSATNHYGLSTIEQIKALPVARLAGDDCALLLWCTWPFNREAHELIRHWGFTFRTLGFDWVKTTNSAEAVALDGSGLHWGMGYYSRSNSEPCLLATRGNPKRLAKDVHSVVLAPVAEHSAKPEEVRRRIERLFAGPYLELYARKPVNGWTTWGDEINRETFSAPAREAAE